MSRESHAYYSSQSEEREREREWKEEGRESLAFLNVQGRPGAVCPNRSEDLSILEVTDVAKNLGTKPPVAPGPCGSTWTWEERELQTVGGGRAGDRPTKTAAPDDDSFR